MISILEMRLFTALINLKNLYKPLIKYGEEFLTPGTTT